MKKFFIGVAFFALMTSAAVAGTLNIVNVETAYGNSENVTVDGYGNPWTTPIYFTERSGNQIVVYCDDLDHDVYVGGGQNLFYKTALVTQNGLGQTVSESASNEAGQVANLGKYYLTKGNEAAATAAQAVIWHDLYGMNVSSSDPDISRYITTFENVKDNGNGYANGLVSLSGTQAQITGVVPETSTWIMMVLGFMGLGFTAVRKTKEARLPV